MSYYDLSDPLLRIANEPTKANQALRDYAFMGPGRSLAKLVRRYRDVIKASTDAGAGGGNRLQNLPPTRRLPTLAKWSVKYSWQARVDRYDELQSIELEYLAEQRRRALFDLDWNLGGELRQNVMSFLAELPRFTTVDETEDIDPATGNTVITRYVKLDTTLGELARVSKLASEIQRLAVNLPTDKIDLSGAALDAAIERELARLANSGQTSAAGEAAPDDAG